MAGGKSRDIRLLDALDALERVPLEATVWRIVKDGRDPLLGSPAKARWDSGGADVIYTSLERAGALAEIGFHLLRQPVFPSRLRSNIHQIRVRTRNTVSLGTIEQLGAFGIRREDFVALSYERSQAVGDAAAFLGFDGMLVPSARWNCRNLVLFTEQLEPEDLEILSTEEVDWLSWKAARRQS